MARTLKSDRILFLAALLLLCTSVVMVNSASAAQVLAKPHQELWLALKQLMWAALGLSILGLAMRFDYRHFKQPPVIWTMVGLAVAGLAYVLFAPAARSAHGAQRWINIGPFGVQPSEFAKLAMVVFTAALLDRRIARINDVAYSLTPIAIAAGVMVSLIAPEPDAGAAISLVAITAIIVFAAGLSWRYLVTAGLALIPLAGGLLVIEPYRYERLVAFFDRTKDLHGKNWQLLQSQIAVGTGGVLGRGLGQGFQKLNYLPEPHNDFIYAVIAEELGLIGASGIVACFAVIAWRGVRIAVRTPDPFGALLAIGITAMIVVQAFVNISVVLGLLPTKGIALPLVSAGGSSLLVNALAVGILLNISQHASAEPSRAA